MAAHASITDRTDSPPTPLARDFLDLLPAGLVITDEVGRRSYECDGLTGFRQVPALVVLPRDAEEVAAAVRICARHGVPFVARGAGTGLSGGALPVADGVVISLQKLRRILEIDVENRRAVLEPGVFNLDITKAAAPHGLYYAPDPSSQQVCTIGGNVAENSGGAHCLKYGFTTNHVLAMEVVLADGSIVTLGGPTGEQAGPDLRGVFLGSEGTLGICTKVTVRLLQKAESKRLVLADFPSVQAAGDTVGDIVDAVDHPGRGRDDGLAGHGGRRGRRRRRVHRRRPRRPDHRAGRPRRRVRHPVRPAHRDLRAQRRHAHPRRRDRGRAGEGVEGPQGRVRRGRADQPRLHRPGRRGPPHPARRGARPHRRDGLRGRPARRQRLPRRRRQPAPAGPLLGGRRRARHGRGALQQHRRAVRRARRLALRASTASGRTRPARCRRCSPRTTSPS